MVPTAVHLRPSQLVFPSPCPIHPPVYSSITSAAPSASGSQGSRWRMGVRTAGRPPQVTGPSPRSSLHVAGASWPPANPTSAGSTVSSSERSIERSVSASCQDAKLMVAACTSTTQAPKRRLAPSKSVTRGWLAPLASCRNRVGVCSHASCSQAITSRVLQMSETGDPRPADTYQHGRVQKGAWRVDAGQAAPHQRCPRLPLPPPVLIHPASSHQSGCVMLWMLRPTPSQHEGRESQEGLLPAPPAHHIAQRQHLGGPLVECAAVGIPWHSVGLMPGSTKRAMLPGHPGSAAAAPDVTADRPHVGRRATSAAHLAKTGAHADVGIAVLEMHEVACQGQGMQPAARLG